MFTGRCEKNEQPPRFPSSFFSGMSWKLHSEMCGNSRNSVTGKVIRETQAETQAGNSSGKLTVQSDAQMAQDEKGPRASCSEQPQPSAGPMVQGRRSSSKGTEPKDTTQQANPLLRRPYPRVVAPAYYSSSIVLRRFSRRIPQSRFPPPKKRTPDGIGRWASPKRRETRPGRSRNPPRDNPQEQSSTLTGSLFFGNESNSD